MTKRRWNLRPGQLASGLVRSSALVLGLSVGMVGNAQDQSHQDQSPIDLTQMQLEDLMNIKVTSVSKKEQTLSRTAAAVFVITAEDIRRSGATSIPDLLRMAPGVDVQQIDASSWAISIRGFNSRYSNKLLVLVDGRSVYTPSFSGVFWEQLEMPLENIERIEVIRGPGATVWGANAVNGVISILTRSSKDTQGGLLTAGGGSQSADGVAQYGGTAGHSGSFRAFARYSSVNNSAMADGTPAYDRWTRAHGGFRSDWDFTKRDSVTVQGDLFANEQNQTLRSGFIPTPFERTFNQEVDAAGGDLTARWNHTLADGSQTSLQTYFDSYRRTDMGVPQVQKTFDIDFQHHLNTGGRNDMVWGGGYRVSNSKLAPGYAIAFSPPSQTGNLFSVFFQDEIRMTDSLWFTAGIKLEHNAYTGLETEPSVRLVWTPVLSRQTIWASAAKAVRQPSRADTSIDTLLSSIPIAPDAVQVLRVYGNPQIKDEEARDYELGYRAGFTKTLTLDATTFLTFYRHLNTAEPQSMQIIPGSPVQFLIPLVYDNKARAVDYGGELSLNWNATARWRVSPGYSYLHATIRQDPSSQGLPAFTIAAGFPQNMFQVRSQVNLSRKMEFDQSLYYTARLPGGSIPGHARLDLRLSRRISDSAELSLVGQNLLRSRTTEYGDSFSLIGSQSLRSVYGKITWRF